MNWSLERSRIARAELDEIWAYIAADNPEAADRQLDRIETIFRNLTTHPKMGRVRDDILPGLRGFASRSYLILYQLDEDRRCIQIVRVVHGMRDLGALFT
jgi:toxin ParE1/3/4